MAITVEERVGFVEQLRFEPTAERLAADLATTPPSIVETRPSGAVDAGSVVSFVTGLSTQHKEDVLDSTLLAQLVATHEHPKEEEIEAWYRRYREVLEHIGWTISEKSFDRYEAGGSAFTVDKVVIEVLAAVATGNEVAMATAALEALKKLSDESNQMKIWESTSHRAESGNFQIGAAQENDGVVAMALGAFYFHTKQTTTHFLWTSWSSTEIELWKAGQVVTLNEQVYEHVRATVVQKLGSSAATFVEELPEF
jgi:hypothetical protein